MTAQMKASRPDGSDNTSPLVHGAGVLLPDLKFGAPIDVNNGIIVGLWFFFLSCAASIYTGLVASRMYAFYQLRHRALVWYNRLPEVLSSVCDSPADLMRRFGTVSLPVISELKAMGHEKASLTVARLHHDIIANIARFFDVDVPNNEFPKVPDTADPVSMSSLQLALMRKFSADSASVRTTLAGLKPNPWPLITPVPFPDYLTFRGAPIGLYMRRFTLLERIQRRLTGRVTPQETYITELAGRRSDCGDCRGEKGCRNPVM